MKLTYYQADKHQQDQPRCDTASQWFLQDWSNMSIYTLQCIEISIYVNRQMSKVKRPKTDLENSNWFTSFIVKNTSKSIIPTDRQHVYSRAFQTECSDTVH